MNILLRTVAGAAGLLALTAPASAFWCCHRPVVVVNVGPAPVAAAGAGYGYAPMGYAPMAYAPMGYAPYGAGYGGCYGSGAGCTGGNPAGAAPDCRQGAGAKPPKTTRRLKELEEKLDGMLARIEASKAPSAAAPVAAAPASSRTDPDGIVARTRQWQQRREQAVSAHRPTPGPAPLPPVIVKAADR